MKKRGTLLSFFKKKLFYFASLLFILSFNSYRLSAQNLITNGDFESGNGSGFTSNYNYIGSPSGSSNQRDYTVTTDPYLLNNANFLHCSDHTSGSGKMMVVDGSASSGDKIWEQVPGGGISLSTGTTYIFSYWVESISNTDAPGNLSNIEVMVNGTVLTPTIGTTTAPSSTCTWTKVTYTWTASTNYAQIWLYDLTTSGVGNDFALDDLSLTAVPPPLSIKYSVINPTCPNGSDGAIIAYGMGGTAPYNYTLNGTTTNTTGVFSGLGSSSNNSLSVTDAASPISATVSANGINVVAPTDPLSVNYNASICPGASAGLSAGGGGTYSWTASPADPTLTNINSATPSANPTVTTTYTVTSTTSSTKELIYNGDFSAGDIGFSSDYADFSTAPYNTNRVQKAYGVVPNSQLFETTLGNCTDHTSGSGNMLAVDGSTVNGSIIWSQTVPVTPNTTYSFSYYLQTLSATNPARIETLINGVSPGVIVTAPTATCSWALSSYTWNSGANTTATITLYDMNIVAGGNDFAIDDISFTAPVTCLNSKSVTVTIGPSSAPAVTVLQPTCATPTGTITITSPVGAGIQYSIGGAYQTSPVFSGLSHNSYIVNAKYPSGCLSADTTITINNPPLPPATPAASVTVQATCSIPTATIVVTSPVGPSIQYSIGGAYQISSTFTGVAPFSNFAVTAKDTVTGCISSSFSISTNPVPATPATPMASVTVQPNCATPTGTIVVTSPTGATILYSIGGAYQASGTFTGLTNGTTYTVTAKDNSTGCISAGLPLTVNPIMGAPSVPVGSIMVQPTCSSPTGTIVITSPLGANIQYSNGGSYQVNGTFSGLTPGMSYAITAKDISTGCVSAPLNLTINAIPNAPATPIASIAIQPTCIIPTGTIVVTSPVGATIQYSDGGAYQVSGTFTGLTPGTSYSITAKDISTGCVSSPLSLTVNTIPNPPAIPVGSVTVQPTCSSPTGSIMITSPSGANIEFCNGGIYQTSGTFGGLIPNTYSITAKDIITGCISSPLNLTVNAVPNSPTMPVGSVIAQPGCVVNTGTIVVTSPSGVNIQYSDGGIYQTSGTFSGLASNTYSITAKDITTGCISSPLNLTVNAVPNPPAIPVGSVVAQPTCITSTGTIMITSPSGANIQYSDGGPFQNSGTFGALIPNTYSITVKDILTGCISSPLSLTVNTVPNPPATPVGSVTVQPTCSLTTGTLVIISPSGLNIQYDIGSGYQSNGTFANLLPGQYPVTAKDMNTGCISTASVLTVNPIPNPPATPTGTVTQPGCIITTGTIVVNSPVGANIQYSDGGVFQNNGTFGGLTPNTYSITAKDITTGCISNAGLFTVNPLPAQPSAPVASVTVQPACLNPGGTIIVSSPIGNNFTYSDGGAYQSSTTFAGLNPNKYSVTYKDVLTGCISLPALLMVNSNQTPPPSSPIVVAPPRCGAGSVVLTASGNGTLNWYTDPALSNLVNTGTTYNTTLSSSTFFYVTATVNTCSSLPKKVLAVVTSLPIAPQFPQNLSICPGDSLLLNPGLYDTYLWQDNSTKPTFTVTAPGNYSVLITVGACQNSGSVLVSERTLCDDIYFPSAFTPNNDGNNDGFRALGNTDDTKNYLLQIYNRWGLLVFSTNEPSQRWNGEFKGTECNAGNYVWIAHYQFKGKEKMQKGNLILIR